MRLHKPIAAVNMMETSGRCCWRRESGWAAHFAFHSEARMSPPDRVLCTYRGCNMRPLRSAYERHFKRYHVGKSEALDSNRLGSAQSPGAKPIGGVSARPEEENQVETENPPPKTPGDQERALRQSSSEIPTSPAWSFVENQDSSQGVEEIRGVEHSDGSETGGSPQLIYMITTSNLTLDDINAEILAKFQSLPAGGYNLPASALTTSQSGALTLRAVRANGEVELHQAVSQ